MGTKSNFTQALRELTGFDEPVNAGGSPAEETVQSHSTYAETFGSEATEFQAHVSQRPAFQFEVSAENCTQITEHMVIKGDIKSNDDVVIGGQVFGNVTTSGNLSATALIYGDVKAENIALNGGHVKGNIALDGNLQVGEKSIVIGDINAGNIIVSGKIKGNLDLADSAVLHPTALISGNIIASNILTDAGARINGSITTRNTGSDFDMDAEFDLGVDFNE